MGRGKRKEKLCEGEKHKEGRRIRDWGVCSAKEADGDWLVRLGYAAVGEIGEKRNGTEKKK